MARFSEHLRRFHRELQRRKVLRVLMAYAVVAWLVIVVVETTWAALHLPAGTLTVVILVAVAAIPVVAVLAWRYDLVPDRGTSAAPAAAVLDGMAAAAGVPATLRRAGTATGDDRSPRPLPSPATPFIGRQAELAELGALLDTADCRLVTVLGPGGIGKTRLVLRAAQERSGRYRHGVVFVPLSGLSSAELLAPALAESFGMMLSRRDDPLVELLDFVREKEMLLVLDNFEHLTDGAGIVATIVEHAPGMRVLITSRERLNVRSETVLLLDGLPLLDDGSAPGDALRLFIAAAQRADARFEVDASTRGCIVRICELLGGMPLAIELAAAWVRVLPCAEIAAQLERGVDILSSTAADLPERHRSMRATFEASWRLLAEAERRALTRIAVLRSSFDREAAHAVADVDAALLRVLLDKSLLSRAGDRFLMLDVVRQYALERLREQPGAESAARARHLTHYLALVAEQQPGLLRCDPAALGRIADVIDEVRAAWAEAVARGDVAAIDGAADGLFHFYEARGWAREGRDAFARAAEALARARDSTAAEERRAAPRPAPAQHRTLARARLDVRRGVFCDRLGEHAEAETLLRHGITVARELGETAEVVFALHRLGANRLAMGDYAEADHMQRDAKRLADTLDDRHATGWSLTHLGNLARASGGYEQAASLYREALAIHREQDDRNGLWTTLNNLGTIAGMQNDYAEARRRFGEALEVQVELGNKRSAAMLLHNLGCVSRNAGDHAAARQHLEAARTLAEEMGYRTLLALSLTVLADIALAEQKLHDAHALLQQALRNAAAAKNYPVAIVALLTMARLRLAQGDRVAALDLAALIAAHPAAEREERDGAAALIEELGGSNAVVGKRIVTADGAAAADGRVRADGTVGTDGTVGADGTVGTDGTVGAAAGGMLPVADGAGAMSKDGAGQPPDAADLDDRIAAILAAEA